MVAQFLKNLLLSHQFTLPIFFLKKKIRDERPDGSKEKEKWKQTNVTNFLQENHLFLVFIIFLFFDLIVRPSFQRSSILAAEQRKRIWAAKRPLERHSSSTDITFPIITILNSIACKQLGIVKGNVLWKIECFLED